MKYFFILGKNWHLSLAEINHMLQKVDFKGKIIDYSACSAIVQFEKEELKETQIGQLQFMLGGTQKIGKVVEFIEYQTFMEAFPEEISSEVHPGVMIDARKRVTGFMEDSGYPIFGKIEKDGNYFVANSIYPIEFRSNYYKTLIKHFLHYVNKFWMDYLKRHGAKKAIYFRYPEENVNSGNLNPIFPHHFFQYELYLPTKKEITYCLTNEGLYIGYVLNVTNANEQKMIDEERPFIDQKSAIPPKFAKIMVSLLNLKQPLNGMRILDPFCGSGTILLFAYSLGIQVYGSDIDTKKVAGTKKNLKWIQKFLEKPTPINLEKNIIQSNINELSKNFNDIKFHGIVSEPILLPFYNELPAFNDLEKHIKNEVLPTYQTALNEFKKILKNNSRVCLTSASIETLDGGTIRIDLNNLAEDLGYKIIPILDTRIIKEKKQENLRLKTRRNISFDGHTKFMKREFYLFGYEE